MMMMIKLPQTVQRLWALGLDTLEIANALDCPESLIATALVGLPIGEAAE